MVSKQNQNKIEYRGQGLGFFSILGLIFITLKLTGYIDWSWWLVLLPLYGPLALVLSIILIAFAIGGIMLGSAKVIEKLSR